MSKPRVFRIKMPAVVPPVQPNVPPQRGQLIMMFKEPNVARREAWQRNLHKLARWDEER